MGLRIRECSMVWRLGTETGSPTKRSSARRPRQTPMFFGIDAGQRGRWTPRPVEANRVLAVP